MINKLVQEQVDKNPEILKLINCITIQQGPGEVLMCMKIKCKDDLNALQISTLINKFEAEIRQCTPEVKWIYIEPDLQEWES